MCWTAKSETSNLTEALLGRRDFVPGHISNQQLIGGPWVDTPGDLNSTCFPVTFSPLISRLVASRLPVRLRGPEGLPCCRCVGLHVASRLSIRLRGPEGLPCCWIRCFGLSFHSWLTTLRVLLGSDPQLRFRLRSSLVRRCGLLLRSSLRAPPLLSDLFDCTGHSFDHPLFAYD